MNSILLILALCTVMWYVIDNLKKNLWAGLPYSRLITIGIAAAGAFAIAFVYNLDLLNALAIVDNVTVLGKIITALAMMSGSAVVSELVDMFREKN